MRFEIPCKFLASPRCQDKGVDVSISGFSVYILSPYLLEEVLCVREVNVGDHLSEDTLQRESGLLRCCLLLFAFLLHLGWSASFTLFTIIPNFLFNLDIFLRFNFKFRGFSLDLSRYNNWLFNDHYLISSSNKLLDLLWIHYYGVNGHTCGWRERIFFFDLNLCCLIELMRAK